MNATERLVDTLFDKGNDLASVLGEIVADGYYTISDIDRMRAYQILAHWSKESFAAWRLRRDREMLERSNDWRESPEQSRTAKAE